MPQRVQVSINLGGDAPIETVASAINDMSTLCIFGGELQAVSDRARARIEVARNPRRWIQSKDYYDGIFLWPLYVNLRDPYPDLQFAPLPESAISDYLSETGASVEAATTVERVEYRNPVEIIMSTGAVAYAVYLAARDWSQRRRLNELRVDDYESEVALRRAVREHLISSITAGEVQLTPEQIGDLLSSDVANAFKNIGNARPSVELLGRRQSATEDENSS